MQREKVVSESMIGASVILIQIYIISIRERNCRTECFAETGL